MGEKHHNFVKNDSRKVELYNSWTHFEVYTKTSSWNSWTPHFIITILDQKSRNAGTSCISITFSNKLHFLPSLQFALLLLHAIIKEPVMLMDLVNVMLNSQELIATLQVNRYKDMIISTTIYTKVFCDVMSHVIR